MTGPAQRDIFFVSNSVDELGGVTTWSHQMARLFTERGHRVHVVGVTRPAVPQELGELPYPTTTLYDIHPPRVGPVRGLGGGSTSPGGECVPSGRRACGRRPPN